jgi:hypothetical protein
VIKNFWERGQFENLDIDAIKTLELRKLGSNYMHLILFNPLPSLTLQSARDLNVPCRPKRSKSARDLNVPCRPKRSRALGI